MIRLPFFRLYAAMLLIIFYQGCAELGAIRRKDQVAEHAEAVFRRQNALTSRIMMSADEAMQDDTRLYEAEMKMHDACKLLNEYSTREIEEKPLGMLFKRRVRASIKACEDSIRAVESALEGY